MKRTYIIFLCLIIALVSGVFGFFIGINLNNSKPLSKDEKDIAGTYKANNWNGNEAVLVINEDNTFIHPNGYNGTWSIDGDKILLQYDYSYSYGDGNIVTNTQTNHQEAIIVDKGIMINTHFFEKLE